VKSWAFAGALLAVLCVSGVAEAGDPAVYKAPPPVSGAAAPGVFYAGVSLGGRWSDTDWMTTAIGSPPSPPNFGPAIPASFGSSTVRIGGRRHRGHAPAQLAGPAGISFADYGHLDHTFFASPAGDRVVMNEALQTQTLLVGFAYKLGPPSQLVAQH